MSYVSTLYHIILRTKYSEPTITENHETLLYAYMTGLIRHKYCKVYRIGGMPDHVHLLVSIHQNIALSEFVKVLKSETSKWLKSSEFFPYFKGWGVGYAAFSYHFKDKDRIYKYICHQKQHHKTHTFQEEYEESILEVGLNPDNSFNEDL